MSKYGTHVYTQSQSVFIYVSADLKLNIDEVRHSGSW